jgi:DNA-directed RNA polymerase specialized sigma24 family protein
MAHELLEHPDVLKTIRFELLRGGYPHEEVEDGVREVVASVFEYLEREKETIETPDRMKAVVRGPSYARGVDARRAKGKRGKTSAGPTDEADAHEAPASSHEDRLDMRRALETMDANKEGNEGALIQGLAAGVSQKEIAAGLNVSHAQLRKDTVAMRSRHTKLLRAAGYGGAVIGLFVLLVLVFRTKYGPDEQAKPQPLPAPTFAPPAPPEQVPVAVQGPTPEDRQKASDLRTKAHAEWASKEWRTCMSDYFDADKLEPDGADAPAQKELGECTDRYEATFNSKPR